ncbi:hypothetical protein BFP97_16755 [Roseivirga sp. 4D4]|uniref:Fur family transcriptional regulator n=1 Tax=Roseivirga sp. 4D4 TaxID=1889784 RepID=UPI0008532484|nr:transcriptional repressor [Roseivirga sp. 4D4]OEK03068.1 hypothetical protein BFP97_16755 [Roseivirga sp. 4D4]
MDNKFKQLLTLKKLRSTALRLLILETLAAQEATTSLFYLRKVVAKSQRVSLYRTLKIFQESGLVHSINDGTRFPTYGLNYDLKDFSLYQGDHPHFHCNVCELTYCLPRLRTPDIKLPRGYKNKKTSLLLNGICPECLTETI